MLKITDEELLNELKKRFNENKKTVDELNRLNRILTKVNDKLSEAEAMKSHFISNISNEIINPFTSIMALSENILEADKESWKKVISMVSLIYKEAFNLDFQFKNIFAAARIEAGEVSLENSKTEIISLVNEVLDTFKYEIKRKKIDVKKIYSSKKDEKITFNTDAAKLKLIISNILSNAIKFSNEQGVIEIISNIKNNNLELSIIDYGVGISKENEETIFDRFKKLDSGINSVNRGHGLGLSIVKAYIDLLNGNIEVKSIPGKGSTFKIIVPESSGEIEGFSFNGDEMFFEEEQI